MSYYYGYSKNDFYDLIGQIDYHEAGQDWKDASEVEKKKIISLMNILSVMLILLGSTFLILPVYAYFDDVFSIDEMKYVILVIIFGIVLSASLFIYVKKGMNNIINGKVLKKVSFFIHASKPVKGFGVAYGVCNQNGEVIIGTIGSDNILNKKVWKASPGDCLNLFRTEKGESYIDWNMDGKTLICNGEINNLVWRLIKSRKFVRGNDHRLLEIYEGRKDNKILSFIRNSKT